MQYAVGKRNLQLVTTLLDKQADPDPGLRMAVDSNATQIAKMLLDRGADPSAELGNASARGQEDVVRRMLEKGGIADRGIDQAIAADQASIVEMLANAGADANKVLPYAVRKGRAPLVELALYKGAATADPALVATAAGNGDLPVLLLLLDKGQADANPGMEPAVTNQGEEVVKVLLAHGADAQAPTLIAKAAERGSVALVTLLLENGADATNGVRGAVDGNSLDVLTLLSSKGADLNATGLVEASALRDNPALTRLLLDAGCPAQEGVVNAVASGSAAVLDLLLEHGADVRDAALMATAVEKGYAPVVTNLLKGGCDAKGHVDPASGGNLLHVAALREDLPVAQLLIAAGFDVSMKAAGSGDTPLHVAVRGKKDNMDLVEALVEAGSDVNAVNIKGKSIKDECGGAVFGSKVRKYIKQHGGK